MTGDDGQKDNRFLPILVGLEQISVIMAILSGVMIMLLAIFITADVIGRRVGGIYSGATDEISGFVMAMAATWALAYTLTIDKHVRVDIIFGFIGSRLRRVLDLAALLLLAVFACLLSYSSWKLAVDSFEIGALSPSVLQVPLGIPQSIMALGFTALAFQSTIALLIAALDPVGFETTRRAESAAAPEQFDI